MEWQPIETAPNDKILILGFFYNGYEEYAQNEHADCFIQLGKLYHGAASVICGAPSNHYVSLNIDVNPTHWMPLPDAPK